MGWAQAVPLPPPSLSLPWGLIPRILLYQHPSPYTPSQSQLPKRLNLWQPSLRKTGRWYLLEEWSVWGHHKGSPSQSSLHAERIVLCIKSGRLLPVVFSAQCPFLLNCKELVASSESPAVSLIESQHPKPRFGKGVLKPRQPKHLTIKCIYLSGFFKLSSRYVESSEKCLHWGLGHKDHPSNTIHVFSWPHFCKDPLYKLFPPEFASRWWCLTADEPALLLLFRLFKLCQMYSKRVRRLWLEIK